MSLLPRRPADAALVVDLARIVGAGAVSTLDADRFAYARDCWPRDLIRIRSGEVAAAPSCVVWPETPEEVARVLALAAELGLPVVPFGAGSGVSGGARPSAGGIALDLKRMRAIRRLDAESLRAEVEVGIIGERLERILEARGFTLGHFPSSILCSTLGGWLAARSAGQTSTLYGKIEDMCLGMEVVTPGRVRRLMQGPRPGLGPDFNALVIGSEGCFGVITAAELRLRPAPAARPLRGFRFPSVEAGLEAIRKMLRAGYRPAVVRLYDALDTFVGRGHGKGDEAADEARSVDVLARRAKGVYEDLSSRFGVKRLSGAMGGALAHGLVRGTVRAVLGAPVVLSRAIDALPSECLLILGFEGQPALVGAEMVACAAVCAAEGAEDLGPGPGEHWLKNRHNVSFKQSKAYENGVFTDTMEVAATWDRLGPMYRAVRKAISRDAFVMAHFSHAYPEGCSIYFTFAGAAADPSEPSSTLERYDRIWKNALRAVSETGGTISHHHGVGILKAQAMEAEHGPGGMRLLRALKHGFDPHGIMNPGKLALEAPSGPRLRHPSRAPAPIDRSLPPEIVSAVGEGNLELRGSRTTVRPPDESALAAVLRVAHARRIAVATDQTGVRTPPGAVRLDLSRLEGVVRLSAHSLFVEAEAGVRVDRLEALLQRHGLTLGPVHPRAANRSLGACLARNLLVRRGTAYGDLGNLCFALRGLTANGAPLETRPVPRSATGPELDRALIGGKARWGVITRATLRVATVRAARAAVAWRLPSAEAGVEWARRVLRLGVRPAAGRVLSDGVVAAELAAADAAGLAAQRAVLSGVAAELGGSPTEPGTTATDGRFDAVVEIELPWSLVPAGLSAVAAAGGGETWVDFWAPEAASVIARVSDRDARRAAAAAGTETGGRVVAGLRDTEGDEPAAASRRPTTAAQDPDEGAWGPYEDVAERVARTLDPAGVFRGR